MQEGLQAYSERVCRLAGQVDRAMADGVTYAAARRQVARRNGVRRRELNSALAVAKYSTREWEGF
jgi:hypothetical protein